ncbi:hypothetical protein K2173_009860 [Erythroxylum novogranatense]|uniref:Stress-associated endoplasmic reticulum protein n=1 Tax=Erythroxylum novogranatense TaxID=1862640 RepID=A0AAV8T0E4_9ROSI|nr:hypothetical protein K2173_009860 [Erythroxylum novogranatense]
MTTSKRVAERKVAKFEKNITKRGLNHGNSKGFNLPVGKILLGIFLFVGIGSVLLLIIRKATKGGSS